jgi:hypothetical protein
VSTKAQKGCHNIGIGRVKASVVDPHQCDADPDSTYHPEADPDSDFLFDAVPDTDPAPAFHPDADPDQDPSFKKKARILEKMLK